MPTNELDPLEKTAAALKSAREGDHDIHVRATTTHQLANNPQGYVFPATAFRRRFAARIAEASTDGRLLTSQALIAFDEAIISMIDAHEARVAREVVEKGVGAPNPNDPAGPAYQP